jgi:hypothetical protein
MRRAGVAVTAYVRRGANLIVDQAKGRTMVLWFTQLHTGAGNLVSKPAVRETDPGVSRE